VVSAKAGPGSALPGRSLPLARGQDPQHREKTTIAKIYKKHRKSGPDHRLGFGHQGEEFNESACVITARDHDGRR